MIDIDYDRFYRELTLEFLTAPIGDFTKDEVELILNGMSLEGSITNIDIYGIREAFLRSVAGSAKLQLQDKLRKVNAREAYEFLFRAEVLDRIKKLQK